MATHQIITGKKPRILIIPVNDAEERVVSSMQGFQTEQANGRLALVLDCSTSGQAAPQMGDILRIMQMIEAQAA